MSNFAQTKKHRSERHEWISSQSDMLAFWTCRHFDILDKTKIFRRIGGEEAVRQTSKYFEFW
jgi:hypothetical protein